MATAQAAGPSVFQQQREIALRKDRTLYEGKAEQLQIDYRAAHSKAFTEPALLHKQFNLEAEEAGNACDEFVQANVSRINQLKQEYLSLMKDIQRRHIEQQQRRFAGSAPEVPDMEAAHAAVAAAGAAQAAAGTASIPPTPKYGASSGGAGHFAPPSLPPLVTSGSLKGAGAAHALRESAPSSPATPVAGGLSTASFTGTAPHGASDFAKLEAMHSKFMNRTRGSHEANLGSRAGEVAAWAAQHSANMDALSQHQQVSLTHLASCVSNLKAWHADQRAGFASAHADVMAELQRLSKLIEALQTSAAAKLTQLLVTYLTEKQLPPGEAGLTEIQTAFGRALNNLKAEHMATLDATEASLRVLPQRHAALREHVGGSYVAGLAGHEGALAQASQLHQHGLMELQQQYDAHEARHRGNLQSIREAHLHSLAGLKEAYLGEAAALLEEYRARLAELRGHFLVTHDADIAEV